MAKKRSGVEKWAEDKGSGKASVLAAVIWSNYIWPRGQNMGRGCMALQCAGMFWGRVQYSGQNRGLGQEGGAWQELFGPCLRQKCPRAASFCWRYFGIVIIITLGLLLSSLTLQIINNPIVDSHSIVNATTSNNQASYTKIQLLTSEPFSKSVSFL